MDSELPSYTQISNQTDNFAVDAAQLMQVIVVLREQLGVQHYFLDLAFITPEKMQEMNASFRGKTDSTDVLSFPQLAWPEPLCVTGGKQHEAEVSDGQPPKVLGDILVSLEDAEKNAQNLQHNLDREVAFLLIHGLLHLCGHDHQDEQDEALMIAQQQALLQTLSGGPSGPLWRQSVWRL